MTSNVIRRFGLLLASSSLVGCTGVQTGGEMNGYGCVERRVPVLPEDELAIGFAPSVVLPIVAEARTAVVRYTVPSGHSLSPASTETRLHLDIQVDDSSLYFVDLESEGGVPSVCEDYLAVGVTLGLTSDDGAFSEVIATELTTRRADRLDNHFVLAGNEVRGSFALSNGQPGDKARYTYDVYQVFEAGLWLGRLQWTYHEDANSGSGALLPVVDWGYSPCKLGTVPVEAQDLLRGPAIVKVQNILEHAPIELIFSDGTSATGIARHAVSATACRVIETGSALAPDDAILVNVQFEVNSSDGRWSGSLPTEVSAELRDGQLVKLSLRIDGPRLGKGEFEAYYGLTGLDFGTYDVARLRFGVEYAVSGEPRATSGHFEVLAPNQGGCADCPKGSPEVVLLDASVGPAASR